MRGLPSSRWRRGTFLEPLERRDLLAIDLTLVQDINTAPEEKFFEIGEVARVGDDVFFTAWSGTIGIELWKWDAQRQEVVLVKDILPGTESSVPRNLTNVEGTLFFSARIKRCGAIGCGPDTGEELWLSDGTAAGTRLVKDISPGDSSSSPRYLTNVNGTLFFVAHTDSGSELWRSDGTDAGTQMVLEIVPGHSSSDPAALTDVNGTLFFTADSDSGRELWTSDGTASGTRMVKEIYPGDPSGASATPMVAIGNIAFFVGQDSEGRELWRSDGTEAGTFQVKDIAPGYEDANPLYLTDVNGTVYFRAEDFAGGEELWKSDGTPEGTVRVKDIATGQPGSEPKFLTNVNGTLYFVATVNGVTGFELYKSDGTAAGTMLVKDISPGPGESVIRNLTGVGDVLYFVADDFGATGREIWRSDGTSAGTQILADLRSGSEDSYPDDLIAVEDRLYFTAFDGIGFALWESDGTPENTRSLLTHGTRPSSPRDLVDVGGTLFFAAEDDEHGRELWKSDGTQEGTVLVKDIYPGTISSAVSNLAAMNGFVFFSARSSSEEDLFWRSDGTAEGTVVVKEVEAHSLTNVNGTLYFRGYEEVSGSGLWTSDGTRAGTVRVMNTFPEDLVAVGDKLFFVAGTPEYGEEVWVAENGGASLAHDARPGPEGSNPEYLQRLDDETLTFLASDSQGFRQLWATDGSGAEQLTDVSSYNANHFGKSFASVNDTLFFSFNGPEGGVRELWASDGTRAGTRLFKDLPNDPPSGTGRPGLLTEVDGRLFFVAGEYVSGEQETVLWTSDGTESGTVRVRPVLNPEDPTSAGGRLFFVSHESTYGKELWYSDGTASGTSIVDNIAAGSASSSPEFVTESGGNVFVVANDGIHGRELWVGALPHVLDPPKVTAVRLGSSAWDDEFRSLTDPELSLGYPIPDAYQIDPLPWAAMDQIAISFDSDVNVHQSDLAIYGVSTTDYSDRVASGQFTYLPEQRTAVWKLSAPLDTDRLRLSLRDAVTDSASVPLDGEWSQGDAQFPSGDGVPGADFEFMLNILVGDADQNGLTSLGDLQILAGLWQQPTGVASTVADFDGSNRLTLNDLQILAARWQHELPTAPAVGAAAPAAVDLAPREITGAEPTLAGEDVGDDVDEDSIFELLDARRWRGAALE